MSADVARVLTLILAGQVKVARRFRMPRLRGIADAAAVRIAAVLAVCLSVFARADTVFWRRRAVSLNVYYSTSVAFTRRGAEIRGTRDVTRGHDKSAQKFLYEYIIELIIIITAGRGYIS